VGEAAFRTIAQLAERCGHYCWLEDRLFALTGQWASAPATDAAGTTDAAGAAEAEVRVVCSEMSSWHGFAAAAWWDRLPVRAGVDAGALVVPPAGPITEALDLLAGENDVLCAFGGLVGQIMPALLVAYDGELVHASPVCEAPVRALLDLVRPRIHHEIERGAALLHQGGTGGSAPTDAVGGGVDAVHRLQRVLGAGSTIFPDVRAS
jgi:hypothetical protein